MDQSCDQEHRRRPIIDTRHQMPLAQRDAHLMKNTDIYYLCGIHTSSFILGVNILGHQVIRQRTRLDYPCFEMAGATPSVKSEWKYPAEPDVVE